MYDIPYFKAADAKEVLDYMHDHPFIMLCGADKSGRPVVTHIPVLFEQRDEKLFLLAHAMKKQLHTQAFQTNPKVLAVFHGPHTYVSASWYEEKKTASTWNYQAVHAEGILRFLDERGLLNILTRLTAKFENDANSPSLVQKMDKQYVESLMKAIVAFEIEITSINHVFKLSQNRDQKSYRNIVEHLSGEDPDQAAIAKKMTENEHKVFEQGKDSVL